MTKPKAAHAGGTADVDRTPTVPSGPIDHSHDVEQLAADHQAHVVELFRTMHALYIVIQDTRKRGETPSADLLDRQREAVAAFHAAGGHDAMGVTP